MAAFSENTYELESDFDIPVYESQDVFQDITNTYNMHAAPIVQWPVAFLNYYEDEENRPPTPNEFYELTVPDSDEEADDLNVPDWPLDEEINFEHELFGEARLQRNIDEAMMVRDAAALR